MAQPANTGEGAFLAHLPNASPNASLQGNRSTAGSKLAPAMGLTPAPVGHYLPPDDWEPDLLNQRTGLI
jgi:hypothetical protein